MLRQLQRSASREQITAASPRLSPRPDGRSEPDLPATAEPDQLALAPEEEGTNAEVKSKSEETDEQAVNEIVNKTATKTRPAVAELNFHILATSRSLR